MSPFAVKVHQCAIERTQDIVPIDEVDRAIQTNQRSQASESKARHRIAKVLQAARVHKKNAYAKADQLLEDCYQQIASIEENWRLEIEQRVISQTLNWLIDKDQIEKQLVVHTQEHIRQQIRQVITAWANEQTASERLIEQIYQHIENDGQMSDAILYVNPAHFEQMNSTFGRKLTVESRADLLHWQAEISSRYVILRFDLKDHLERILNTFSLPAGEMITFDSEEII